jgi:NAD(P)H-hydrate repair Nnr-like enzyme with NAD(P)H-hydrate dehydratase domain
MKVREVDADLLREMPLPHHPDDSDKEGRGRLLVIGGSRELPGAALLAGVAALRAGAGKLQIATAESVSVQIGVAVPEARVIPHRETEEGCVDESAIETIVDWAGKAQAVMIGCGMQHGPSLDKLLDALFACGAGIPARARRCSARQPGRARGSPEGMAGRSDPAPPCRRDGAPARMRAEDVAADPLGSARQASERFNAVAVMKGQNSYIVAPDGRAFRFSGGGVGLATSGSGDTLAGIVGGLAARGTDPVVAAIWGVYLHGAAGRRLMNEVGRVGFLARELLDLVPKLMEGR